MRVSILTLLSISLLPMLGHAQQKPTQTLSDQAAKNFSWRSIGPANMGGRITALAVCESDPNIWWAASASGGLLKTTNNGITFEHQFDHEATVSIGDVQVAPSDPNIVWVGTGEGNPRNSSSWGDGVYKSTDGGKTWKNMGLKKIFQTGRLAIHPTDPNIVYVGALGRLWGANEDRGLFKTSDAGKTWEKVLFVDNNTGVIDVQINYDEPDTLLVATYERQRDAFDGNDPEKKFGPGGGIYRTTDGGKTFTKLEEGLPSVKLGRVGLSIYRKDPKHVFAIIETEKIGTVPDNFPYVGFSGASAEVGGKITSLSKDAAAEKAGLKVGDIVITVDGNRILDYSDLQREIRKKSAGEKSKWEVMRGGKVEELTLEYGKREEPSEEERERASNARVNTRSPFSASLGGQVENLQGQQGKDEAEYGGVYHSTDGGVSWKRINTVNPRPMYYSQIRVDPSDRERIYILGTSLYRSDDGGETFTSDGARGDVHVDHHALWIDPRDGRHVILGNDGGVYVTYDRMDNWDHLNHMAIAQFYHVGVAANENYRVYGGLQDNGSWGGPSRVRDAAGPMNSDWFRVGGGDGFVCLVDPTDPEQIYYESQNGSMGRTHLGTGERGSIRPRAPRGTTYRFNWKTPFILSPHNPQIHYSAGNFVFRSFSKGDNVEAISPEITLSDKGAGSAISESPRKAGVIYAGTTDGALWMTKDGGNTWTDLRNPADVEERVEQPPSPDITKVNSASESTPASKLPARRIEALRASDKNKDGEITKEELPPQLRQLMAVLDKNNDGKLSGEEIPAAKPGEASKGSQQGKPEQKSNEVAGQAPPPKAEAAATGEASEKKDDDKKRKKGKKKALKNDAAQASKKDAKKPDESSDKPLAEKTQADEKSPEDSASKVAAKETDKVSAKELTKEAAKESTKEANDPISGKWRARFLGDRFPRGQDEFTLELKLQPENKLKGSFQSPRSAGDIAEGAYDPKENALLFIAETQNSEIHFSAKLNNKSMSGFIEIGGGEFKVDFEAVRAPQNGVGRPGGDGKPIYELVPEPRWVSSLNASKFVDGRCYVTLDGHRSDDLEPYLFVSEDYGDSWKSLRSNLPATVGSTRVLREDIENPNVLYLGCEFSAWVSIDRGANWTRLSNLPTVAVHEFAQHPTRGEVVAGTHGRSLWIMDATVLRQLSKEKLAAAVTLFAPNKVIRWRSMPSRGSSGTRQFSGSNPERQAEVYYSLGARARDVKLTISNLMGDELFETEGSTDIGLHRVSWGLTRPSGGRSRSVPTGEYLITLNVDGEIKRQILSVVGDPDYPEPSTSAESLELIEALLGVSEEDEASDQSRINDN